MYVCVCQMILQTFVQGNFSKFSIKSLELNMAYLLLAMYITHVILLYYRDIIYDFWEKTRYSVYM